MTHIYTEIREDKFDLSFSEDENVPKPMREFGFWRKCCSNFTISKISLLDYLYKDIPKESAPREELYPILEKLGYKRRRCLGVIKELEKDEFITLRNGSVFTNRNPRIIRNIQVVLALWSYANEHKKPKGAKKNRELRYTIQHYVTNSWKSLRTIVKEYVKNHGTVSRVTIQRALDEKVGKIFQRKSPKKGKYTTYYYKLK